MERKLATIRRINEIRSIPDADMIEVAVVDGWEVVIKKNEFNVGDLACYFEIDSFIPTELAPFLSKGKSPREYNGVKGERLKTIRLKGQISQGLLIPLNNFDHNEKVCSLYFFEPPREGDDLTEVLGIQKWEKPIPAQLQGVVKGNFPTNLCPKTDADRAQNLSREFEKWKLNDLHFEVTEKLDGTSFTCIHYKNGDHIETHVCSRNLSLKETDENLYWQIARKYDILSKLEHHNLNIAIQGEIIGKNVQSGQFKIEPELRVFSIYDIDKKKYFLPNERQNICKMLGLTHVPIISENMSLQNFNTIFDMLAFAEGKSLINGSEREGLVWKCTTNTSIMFKTISNKWLILTGN